MNKRKSVKRTAEYRALRDATVSLLWAIQRQVAWAEHTRCWDGRSHI
jgi:hypothetical protein